MSASLVGSEMCIRDRPGPAVYGPGASARAAEPPPPASGLAGGAGRHAPWVKLDATVGPEPEGLPAGARSRSGSPGDAWPRPAVRGRGGRGGALVRWRLDEQAWDLGDVVSAAEVRRLVEDGVAPGGK
eukprot:10465099-Alexandrium_andersonii.AAC.1